MSESNKCAGRGYCPSAPDWQVVWTVLDDEGNERKSYFCQSCADDLSYQDSFRIAANSCDVDRWIKLTDVDKLQLTLNGLESMESLLKSQLRNAHNLTAEEGYAGAVKAAQWQLNVIQAAQAVALAKFVEMDGPWQLSRGRLR